LQRERYLKAAVNKEYGIISHERRLMK
jgi:hypothetical protein